MGGDSGYGLTHEGIEAAGQKGENEAVMTETRDGALGYLTRHGGFENAGYDFEKELIGEVG